MREEHGILPIALGGDIDALIAAAGGMPTVGLAHALFHPTTGYSLPDAVHVADLVSRAPDVSPEGLSRLLDAHARNIWSDRSYFRMLNRLLFQPGGRRSATGSSSISTACRRIWWRGSMPHGWTLATRCAFSPASPRFRS